MREDPPYTDNHLHWHNGSTCHGCPTLKKAIRDAKKYDEDLFILKKVDKYEDKSSVTCFSIIVDTYGNREHYKRQGKIVATIKRVIQIKILKT